MITHSTAIYTTIYPNVEPFLKDWIESVLSQSDLSFTIWIGADNLKAQCSAISIALDDKVRWVHAKPGENPTELRRRALLKLADEHNTVVLVDSDDLIDPDRVGVAKEQLRDADLVACSMRIVDRSGLDSGCVYKVAENAGQEFPLLTHHFGCSNSAWRTAVLKDCLKDGLNGPALDWMLVCRAWLQGARILGDPVVRHSYRQYGENTARVLPPFGLRCTRTATRTVKNHLKSLNKIEMLPHPVKESLENRLRQVVDFQSALKGTTPWFKNYQNALGNFEFPLPWWLFVAHPKLETLWQN